VITTSIHLKSSSSPRISYFESPNQSDEANGPMSKQLESDCDDTLPWFISISLGGMSELASTEHVTDKEQ